jgi:hypothetical protein
VDRDLVALGRDHHHHLEQVPCVIRADDEPAVRAFSGVFDCQRMVDRVEDAWVGDAVRAPNRESPLGYCNTKRLAPPSSFSPRSGSTRGSAGPINNQGGADMASLLLDAAGQPRFAASASAARMSSAAMP